MAQSPKVAGDNTVRIIIYSNGKQIDESYRTVSVTVRKKINTIPYAKLVLLDGDMASGDFPISDKDDFKPGREIKIDAGYANESQTVFEGIIIKHGIKITGDNYSRLVVEARDKAVKMTIGRKNANYTDSKDSDVIKKLIGNYSGLKADVAATDTQYDELVQYYCSDWDYMLARAETNGLWVIVDDAKVSVQSPQKKSRPELQVSYGDDLIEFQAEMDARTQLTAVTGTTWNLKNQEIVQEKGTEPSLNKQGNITTRELAKVIDLESYNIQTAAPIVKESMQSWTNAQLLKSGLARIRGRMKFQGNAKAGPGKWIELKRVGKRFNGEVIATSVLHDISDGNWISEVEFGFAPDWFIEKTDIVAPPAAGFLPGVEGLQIGVVKKLDEDPEGEYKIQVSVPVLHAEKEGVWARLASFYGSNSIGAFFVPEIGDEVVLGYFNNDPCHPVILGSLYSSKRKAPYELTKENNTKAIVTRSKLKLEFEEDKKIITVETPGGNTIVISDDDKSIILQDQNNNKVKLGTDGISLDSPKDITINAKGKITIDAVGEIGVSSKADVNIEGLNVNAKANVGFVGKGSATAELSASGQTTVKGAMVMIN
jgi:Rhs element Vgr protein